MALVAAQAPAAVEPWGRPLYTATAARRRLELFCFSAQLVELPLVAERFGLPGDEAMRGFEVRDLDRSLDPQWFDGFRSGALRAVASAQLGEAMAQFDEATQLTAVLFDGPDAPSLSHLQAGWGVAQWLCARGATVVLDPAAQRFWLRDAVLAWAPARSFNLSSELSVLVEETPLPDGTFLVHTRGLGKFARPDLLLAGVSRAEWDKAGGVLRAIAAQLAAGAVVHAGQQWTGGAVPVRFTTYTPGTNLPQLHLNNEALVVELQP